MNASSSGRASPTLLAICAATALAGCFGGGGSHDSPPPGDTTPAAVPDSALASSSAYTQFTLTTTAMSSETAEPLTADKVAVPPASETDEPAPVT